jgi:glucose/arabinose dehydrogenase
LPYSIIQVMHRLSGFTFVCCISALLSACGGGSDSESPLPPAERIIGTERLGWDQTAASAEVLASIRYVIYVDDVPSEMQDVLCGSTPGANGFPCSGRLPPMSPGRHTLQLASLGGEGTSGESARSSPLVVVVVTAGNSSLPIGPPSQQNHVALAEITTADRVRLRIEALLTGLTDPTDLAFLPDGRLLVAERGGSIRLVRIDRSADELPDPAVMLEDIETRTAGGLLALAPDPQFVRNGYVYAVYTSARGFRLARFREAGGVLADRVILLDGIPASRVPPAAVLRFGPDAKLFLGLDDGGDARRGGDLGSYNGKLLRFNSDLTTPSDQAGGVPVYALDVNAPQGFDWSGTGESVWVAQYGATASAPGELRALVRPPRDRTGEQRARIVARYLLPEGAQPSQIVIYRGTLIPEFRGNLLMSAGSRGGLLRVQFDATDPLKVVATERLFDVEGMNVRAIAVGTSGTVYVSTSTALLRIAPPGPRAAVP